MSLFCIVEPTGAAFMATDFVQGYDESSHPGSPG